MVLACLRCVALRDGETCPACSDPTSEVDAPHASVVSAGGDARRVFDALRAWRGRQARVQRQEPYMVIPNRTLALLALQQPDTRAAFEDVDGIGPVKARDYGHTVTAFFAGLHRGEAPETPAVVTAPVPDGLAADEEALLFAVRAADRTLDALAAAHGLTVDRLVERVQGLILKGAPDVAHVLVSPLEMVTMSAWLDQHPGADARALAAAFQHSGAVAAPVMVAVAEHRRRQRASRPGARGDEGDEASATEHR